MNATYCEPKTMAPINIKDRWILKYTVRILIRFRQWHPPVTGRNTCVRRLQQDLAALYDDPVKRLIVEATY